MAHLLRLAVAPAAAALSVQHRTLLEESPAPVPKRGGPSIVVNKPLDSPAVLRRRLTPLGKTAWLTELETNRSVVTFVIRLQGDLGREELVGLLNDRLKGCERFKSRIEVSKHGEDAHFVPVTHGAYDCSAHVKPLYVGYHGSGPPSRESDNAGLQAFLSSTSNTPVDMSPSLPQWEVLITQPPVEAPGAGANAGESWWSKLVQGQEHPEAAGKAEKKETAVVFRLHHALADGVSVAALLTSLTDEGPAIFAEMLSSAVGKRGARVPKEAKPNGELAKIEGKGKRRKRRAGGEGGAREKRPKDALATIGRSVKRALKMFARAVLFASIKLGGVALVLAKYSRLLARSVLLAPNAVLDRPFSQLLPAHLGTVEMESSRFEFVRSLRAFASSEASWEQRGNAVLKVLRGVSRVAAWPVMYSSDCGGLPTALVRVGCFGVKGNLGTERATAWSRANPLGGPLGGGPSEASQGATRGGGAGGQQGPVSVSALKRGLKELSSLSSSSSVKSVTINDAVLAAVAGAVGDLNAQADARRVLETGEQAGAGALGYEPRALTVICPVNLRPLLTLLSDRKMPNPNAPIQETVVKLQGNKIGCLLLDLPTPLGVSGAAAASSYADDSVDSPSQQALAAHLGAVSRRVFWCKILPEALVGYVVALASDRFASVSSQRQMQRHTLGQADVAVSNVKGFDGPVHLLGRPVEQIFGFLPPPNGCPVGVAVTSYRGTIQLTVNADPSALRRFDESPQSPSSGGGAEALLRAIERRLHAMAAGKGPFGMISK